MEQLEIVAGLDLAVDGLDVGWSVLAGVLSRGLLPEKSMEADVAGVDQISKMRWERSSGYL